MLALWLVIFLSCPAAACSCVLTRGPEEAVAQAGVLFEGLFRGSEGNLLGLGQPVR
jgi:hypothetical protein